VLFNFFLSHAMLIIFQKVLFIFNSLFFFLKFSKFSKLSRDFISVLINILFKDPVIKSSILFIEMNIVFKFAIMNFRVFYISTLNNLSKMLINTPQRCQYPTSIRNSILNDLKFKRISNPAFKFDH